MLETPRVTTNWVVVGPVADFPPDQHICTTAGGKPVVVFNVDGAFHVISNVCPHAGLPLGEGDRRGMVITCPFHGYAYHIKTGRNLDWPEDEPPVKTYRARRVGGALEIEMTQPVNSSTPPPHERGPAPHDKPADEKPHCDPDPDRDDADKPECPSGYPDQGNPSPQQPATDEPRPRTPPSKEGN